MATVQLAAGTTLELKGEPGFSQSPASGIKNIQVTVKLAGAPATLGGLGSLRLIPTEGTNAKDLPGTYVLSKGTLTATFDTERDWKTVSYQSVVVDQPELIFEIDKPINVDGVKGKPLKVETDIESTTASILAFRASVTEIPPKRDPSACKESLYFVESETSKPLSWKLLKEKSTELNLLFQIDRPASTALSFDAILELCDGDDKWVYRSRPLEIVPLKALPQDRKDAEQLLMLEAPVSRDTPAQALNTSILSGPEGIPELKKGKSVPFELRDGSYHAEILLNCSSGPLELPVLNLVAHDNGNMLLLLKSNDEKALCSSLPPRSPFERIVGLLEAMRDNLRPWPLVGILLFAALAACAFLCRQKISRWLRRGEKSVPIQGPVAPPPLPAAGVSFFQDPLPEAWSKSLAQILQSQLDPLLNLIAAIRDELRTVRSHQLAQSSTDGQVDTSLSLRSLPFQSAGPLEDSISRWWAGGADRDQLDALIQGNYSIKLYRSSNVQDSLRSATNRTFLFQPSEGLAEWLGRTEQGDLFLVPGDPRLFQTGDSLKFLGVLFEGLGASLSNVRFRRVVKVCRLRKEIGSTERYRLVERGRLEFEGRPAAEAVPSPSVAPYRAPLPATTVQPFLPEKELAEVVRRAVGEVVSGGLSGQIQDLSRQVQTLAGSSSRQVIEPPRQDPNVSAALSVFGQRLNTIEGLARLVETLRESLARIEVGVEDLRHSYSLPSAPVFPASDPALPGPAASNLRTRLEGQVEAIPEDEYLPFPPPVTAFDRLESPEDLSSSLQRWWPTTLTSGIPDGFVAADLSAAYIWNLQEAKRLLDNASGDRGWQVDVVHVKLPENNLASELALQIHEPRSIGKQQVLCTCSPSPFTAALLFQFALRVRGDRRGDIAVLPAPGLRLTGSIEGYARLAGGALPEHVTSLFEVTRPAILSRSGPGDLYTVILPMQGNFQ